ncbi:MAG: ABC transporter ATP-binding protein [Ferrovibrionaceae bacterium]
MLALSQADVFYGRAQALHALDLAVAPAEIVAMVGRNGAGKSTALKALAGLLSLGAGRRLLDGRDITGLAPHRTSRAGVALVPEDRQIFGNLSAEENLDLAAVSHRPGPWTKARVFALFPRLAERARARGLTLSGGEQQMLAIGRALMTNPRYLLLDEPTEGLAPVVVAQMCNAIAAIARDGVGILLVEQNAKVPRLLARRFLVVDGGRITWEGTDAADIDERFNPMNAVH